MRLAAPIAAIALTVAAALPAAAAVTKYTTTLSGAGENPPNPSTATGDVWVTIDDSAMTMFVEVSFAGLVGGNASAAHIHCCVAAPSNIGVAVGMTGFPASTTDSYSHLFDMTDSAVYNTTFRNTFGGGTALGSFNALVAGLNSDMAYFNIHDAIYPGGEIRGFLTPVPEPESYALLLAGLGLMSASARARRRA